MTEFLHLIAADPELRREFAHDPRGVLARQGIDTTKYEIPERLDTGDLEARLTELNNPGANPSIPIIGPGLTRTVATARNPNAPVGPPPAAESAPGGDWRAAVSTRGLPLPELEPGQPETKPKSKGKGKAETTQEVDLEATYPDAWYASNGTSVSRAFAKRPEEARRIISELVIGQDDRIRVQNVDQPPYRWVCSLTITAGDSTTWSGTGWLVSPRVVITAGHCVYLHNQGGWVRRVVICPARNGTQRPFTFISTEPRSVEGWVLDHAPEYDYGALILSPTDANHGLGFMGFGVLGDEDLFGMLANITGYPGDKDPGTLWGHTRRVMSVRTTTLTYDIDTYGGMSGAPVLRFDGSDYISVGIHNYGDLAGNQATRVTPEVFGNIEAWKSMAP